MILGVQKEASMKYITINREKLSVSVTDNSKVAGFVIPGRFDHRVAIKSPIEELVYYDILYRSIKARDKREGITGVEYKLAELDPWLIAIAYIMWEGIIQGLTWDTIKFIVQQAMHKMKSHNLAPLINVSHQRQNVSTESEIGFKWEKYSTDGRKLHQIFVGLRRTHRQMTETEKEAVSMSEPGKEYSGKLTEAHYYLRKPKGKKKKKKSA
jgi:hypothetical protein